MIEADKFNQPEFIKALPVTPTGEAFSYAKMLRDKRHNKNLHGEGSVRGLTGFYHNRYYRDGHHEPKKRTR